MADAVDKDPAEVVMALQRLMSANFHIDVPADGTLLEHGVAFDSVGLVQLIALIEEHFQIRFDEDDLRIESFTNLTRLAALVGDMLAKRQGSLPK